MLTLLPCRGATPSRGVVIPRPGGPGGTAGGHGHGGIPACGRGGTVGGSSAAVLDKGKQTRTILDDDEVSSDEDEPLQKRLWQRRLRRRGPRRRPQRRQRLPRPQEQPGARRPPARHCQRPGPRGLRLRVAPPRQPNVPTGVFGHLGLFSSPPFFLPSFFHSLTTFLSRSTSSGAATATGAATTDAVVRAAPGPAPVSEPQTPEGVPEDVVESEGEPKAVPAVVQEEAPAEGAMIAVRTAVAPPSSHGAHAPLSSAPHWAATSGAAASEGMEVVLGHPPLYAPGDISVSETVSTAHQALSQAQHVLRY
jgi:hypothetical protein